MEAAISNIDGKVIQIALDGYGWGDLAEKEHQIVEWPIETPEDHDIEQQLLARRAAGEAQPFVACPFEEYEPHTTPDGFEIPQPVVDPDNPKRFKQRTYVSFDKLTAEEQADIENRKLKVPKLDKTKFDRVTKAPKPKEE